MPQSVIYWLSWLPWCAESHSNPTVFSAAVCGIPSKSYCLLCDGLWNPIQILLSSLPWCGESPQNPTVLPAMVCGIPTKAYCLAWHGVRNHIQIPLSCLLWCAESHPNPTVLSAMVCRIPSKASYVVCMMSVIPSKSYCLFIHGVQNPIQILPSSDFLRFSNRYRVSQ